MRIPSNGESTRKWQRPKPTLRDVAAAAGVSLASTSRALSRPETASAELRARVEKACEALNYIPNYVARSLTTERSHAVGIIIPTIDNPVFAPMLQGAIDTLSASGYAIFIAVCHRSATEEFDQLKAMAARGIDGVILGNPDHTDEAFALLRRLSVPFVCAGGSPRSGHPNAVTFDGTAAVSLAVDRVVAAGHREVAVLSGPASLTTVLADRLNGAVARLKEHGLKPGAKWIVQAEFTDMAVRKSVVRLLTWAVRPTAVICTGDYHAMILLSEAHRLAIKVPEELSITGCNDMFYVQLTRPRLTTIRTPYFEVGTESAKMLLAMLAGSGPPPSIALASTLVEGETVMSPPMTTAIDVRSSLAMS